MVTQGSASLPVTTVSTKILAQGMWYVLDQCGRLLRDAVERYSSDSFSTALALALMKHGLHPLTAPMSARAS